MQWVDWAIVAILVVSTLISLKRGFVKEALSLLIWFLAAVLTMVFHGQLQILLEPYIESPSLRQVSAILLLFVMCLLVGGLFNYLIGQLIEVTGLSGTDRLLGMVFGALRGIIVVVIVLMLGKGVLPVDQEVWWKDSILIPHFERLESWTTMMGTQIKDWVVQLFSSI